MDCLLHEIDSNIPYIYLKAMFMQVSNEKHCIIDSDINNERVLGKHYLELGGGGHFCLSEVLVYEG